MFWSRAEYASVLTPDPVSARHDPFGSSEQASGGGSRQLHRRHYTGTGAVLDDDPRISAHA